MSFHYFAYGSNLWPAQLRGRCPSASPVGPARLSGWSLACDKPSVDGSSKFNIHVSPGDRVTGVVYEIEDGERQALDLAEPLYRPIYVDLDDGIRALTYAYEGPRDDRGPYDWYVSVAVAGAEAHGIPDTGLRIESRPDPVAPGVRAATPADLVVMQGILSDGVGRRQQRYYIHPGDLAWWIYHDDPRIPDHFSCWIQGDAGFVVIDTKSPGEIDVFTRPGVPRMPLVHWAQRRLDGSGDVGWVADDDDEMTSDLSRLGYGPVYAYRSYEWDLSRPIQQTPLPEGWRVRPLEGEHEAETRRAASHAAFESTMPPAMHLDRYLAFMRSPVYSAERDLVAVAPDGSVGAFVIWWADPSGVAQIEPFGTHPAHHRKGVGRALLTHALAEMREAGMTLARVCTDDDRPATGFYEACGFRDVGRLRWWSPDQKGTGQR